MVDQQTDQPEKRKGCGLTSVILAVVLVPVLYFGTLPGVAYILIWTSGTYPSAGAEQAIRTYVYPAEALYKKGFIPEWYKSLVRAAARHAASHARSASGKGTP